jgi:hypothetical protein
MTLCYETSSKKCHKGQFNVVATNIINIYLIILNPYQVGSGIRQILPWVILT